MQNVRLITSRKPVGDVASDAASFAA